MNAECAATFGRGALMLEPRAADYGPIQTGRIKIGVLSLSSLSAEGFCDQLADFDRCHRPSVFANP
jgi:hypothetical protein